MTRARNSLKFVILLGFVSLFADMTYEGARSVMGPYLALFGATGTAVGFVAGFGELIGYGVRLLSGYLSDKTGQYWTFTFIGYGINLLAVPLLAFVGSWEMAACLIIAERFGKAIRNPSRDAMLSYASKDAGRGWTFGLHKALDQTGAIIGPFIVAAVLYFKGSYQASFLILAIPAICALSVLAAARMLYPKPSDLEIKIPDFKTEGFSKNYWMYIAGVSLIAAGYADFPIIAYHFQKKSVISDEWIPIFYSLAMGVSGLSALICGRLYDKYGLSILIIVTILASPFAFFAFSDSFGLAIVGVSLWGIGMGSQDSIMRAVIAQLIPIEKRGTGYGVLNMFFGVCWFLGSVFIGYLYDVSLFYLIVFSVLVQNAALFFFIPVKRVMEKR